MVVVEGRVCRGVQEELGVAAHGSLDESVAVEGLLGNRLAKGKGVAAGVGLGEVQVMGCDGGADVGAASLDSLDSSRGRAVLELFMVSHNGLRC